MSENNLQAVAGEVRIDEKSGKLLIFDGESFIQVGSSIAGTNIQDNTITSGRLKSGKLKVEPNQSYTIPNSSGVPLSITNTNPIWKVVPSITVPSIPSLSPATSPSFIPSLVPSAAFEVELEMPKCGVCRQEVQSVSHFTLGQDTEVFIFFCHGDERRIDVSTNRFPQGTEEARKFVYTQNPWLFDEEAKWQKVSDREEQVIEEIENSNDDGFDFLKWLGEKYEAGNVKVAVA